MKGYMYLYHQGEIHVDIHAYGYDKASYEILDPSEGHMNFDLKHVALGLNN